MSVNAKALAVKPKWSTAINQFIDWSRKKFLDKKKTGAFTPQVWDGIKYLPELRVTYSLFELIELK